jgi:hypothetical protein
MTTPDVRHCAVCGRRIARRNPTWNDLRAYCSAHHDLPGFDTLPPDPFESLPTQAAHLGEDMPPREGTEE